MAIGAAEKFMTPSTCAALRSNRFDLIYTFNVREFQQLAPRMREKICAP